MTKSKKEFKNRWYLLAKDKNDNQIKSFALDRISAVEITNKKFVLTENFDVNLHYKYCFGIMSPNASEPTEVMLSFNSIQGKYIKSLPLHESQEIIIDNEKEVRIKLKIYLTHDFFYGIIVHGQ